MPRKMKCDGCGKTLTKDMELNYAHEISEIFCSFDCGVNRLADYCGFLPIDWKDAMVKTKPL